MISSLRTKEKRKARGESGAKGGGEEKTGVVDLFSLPQSTSFSNLKNRRHSRFSFFIRYFSNQQRCRPSLSSALGICRPEFLPVSYFDFVASVRPEVHVKAPCKDFAVRSYGRGEANVLKFPSDR